MPPPSVIDLHVNKEGKITSFVQCLAKAEPNCLYLRNPDTVSCFSGDNYIRRVQQKTLFVINKLSMHCLGLPYHRRCSNYNVWKNLHHLEYKELCHKRNTS